MANDSLSADDISRHISFLKNSIAQNLNALQGLLFLSCDLVHFIHDTEVISKDMHLLKQWRDLATRFQAD
jgi:hypothetical protein